MEEQGLQAVTSYTVDHPKVTDNVANCYTDPYNSSVHAHNGGYYVHGGPSGPHVTDPVHHLWNPSPANQGAFYFGVTGRRRKLHQYADACTNAETGWPHHADDDGLKRNMPHPSMSTIYSPDFWSRTGATDCADPTALPVNGSEAFYAYNYPNAFSSNTGEEQSNAVTTFLILDSVGDAYLIMTIDAAHDGSGGWLQLDMDATGTVGHSFDPVKFMGSPRDTLTNGGSDSRDGYTREWAVGPNPSWGTYSNGSISFGWDACCNDGMIFGPFPTTAWSLNMKVVTRETRGLDDFRIGTFDADKNDVGYLTLPIKKATTGWGGVQIDGMDCTSYCQRYTDCGVCGRDVACKFAPNNGGCISAAAYVYDLGCPRPAFPPLTRLMQRWEDAFAREQIEDGFDSSAVLRVAMDRIDMTCPCDSSYRISVTVYSAAMSPIIVLEDIRPRLGHRNTFVDIPGLANSTTYHVHSSICIAQGTLLRDNCSPVKIDTLHHIIR